MSIQITSALTGITWNSYTACEYAEGFGDGENATPAEQLEAWAYLIKTGQAWSLQGWYGRTATALIDCGLIDYTGHITKYGYSQITE